MKILSTKLRWMVAVLAMTFAALSGWADVIVTNTVADAWIYQEGLTSNYGGDARLMTAYSGNTGHKGIKIYLRFDISAIGSLDVNDVELNLTRSVADNVHSMYLYGLNDGDAGESWGESSINWSNAPQNNTANGGGSSSFLVGATSLGSFWTSEGDVPSAAGGVLSSDAAGGATARLVDFINADSDGQVTFMLSTAIYGSTRQTWASKELGTYAAPSLSLTTVPEPATIGMLGLGAIVAVLLRRMRT